MAKSEGSARDEAIAWHLKLDDANEAEWGAFLSWLEGDPQHRLEFDRVELAGADLSELRPSPQLADLAIGDHDTNVSAWRWAFIGGGLSAIAASLLLVLSFSFSSPGAARWTAIQTSPGEQRSLALEDGSRVYLNGGTRVLLNERNNRRARLVQGEATFEIKHDAKTPFTVEVGAAELRDVGTIFNIKLDHGNSRIGVIDGAVLYNPDQENVTLTRGSVLSVAAGENSAVLSSVDPRSLGAWREGQLIYDREPLDVVAADVGRILGTQIIVAPEITGQRFTGVIRIDRNQTALFARLGGLLGVKARRSQAGWYWGPDDRAYSNDPRSPDGPRH